MEVTFLPDDQMLALRQDSKGVGKGKGGGKGSAPTAEAASDVKARLVRIIGSTQDLKLKAQLLGELEAVDKPGFPPAPSLAPEEALKRADGAWKNASMRHDQAVSP
eukprot:7568528-Pyramimonas_sp.AAC.1